MDENNQSKQEEASSKISYSLFTKVEMRVGEILSAERVPQTDKLIRLQVDFGFKERIVEDEKQVALVGENMDGNEKDIRQIISGIAEYFPDPNSLIGKKCVFVTNLEPRKIKGLESNGMILALLSKNGAFSLLEPNSAILPGTRVS
jgi:methionyl-tRNA synthetase